MHRAVVNKEKQRLSVAYFLSPTSSARKYVSFSWGDFRKELLGQKRVVGKTALNRYLIPH